MGGLFIPQPAVLMAIKARITQTKKLKRQHRYPAKAITKAMRLLGNVSKTIIPESINRFLRMFCVEDEVWELNRFVGRVRC